MGEVGESRRAPEVKRFSGLAVGVEHEEIPGEEGEKIVLSNLQGRGEKGDTFR